MLLFLRIKYVGKFIEDAKNKSIDLAVFKREIVGEFEEQWSIFPCPDKIRNLFFKKQSGAVESFIFDPLM